MWAVVCTQRLCTEGPWREAGGRPALSLPRTAALLLGGCHRAERAGSRLWQVRSVLNILLSCTPNPQAPRQRPSTPGAASCRTSASRERNASASTAGAPRPALSRRAVAAPPGRFRPIRVLSFDHKRILTGAWEEVPNAPKTVGVLMAGRAGNGPQTGGRGHRHVS